MNLAAIWKLPILFALENNLYSMGTHIARGTSMGHDLSVKAAAYGTRYCLCDGMDLLNVHDQFKEEAARTRSGKGPCLINAATYRYKGHSMSDPQKYRKKQEVAEYQDRDPIQRLAKHLIKNHTATKEQIDELDTRAKQAALEAVHFANESPDTPLEELYTNVYADPFPPYRKGVLPPMLRESDT